MPSNKTEVLLNGALRTFARNGYTRSSIMMIAGESGVSTRTIYNQYESKSGIFEAVIEYSTRQMADHHIQIIRQYLSGNELRASLIAFAERWAQRDPGFDDHQALVRQVQAEREHIPQLALDTWVSLGPLRVRAVLEDELRRLFSIARVPLPDPATAATHLMLLIEGEPISRGFYRAEPLSKGYVVSLARAGVEVFLAAYLNFEAQAAPLPSS